jgi:hypothetical protein
MRAISYAPEEAMGSTPRTSSWYLERPDAPHGNFELMLACHTYNPPPFEVSGQAHWWRDNGNPRMPWNVAEQFIYKDEARGPWLGTSLILSDHYHHLEAVSVALDGQLSQMALVEIIGWNRPTIIAEGCAGPPAFIQSSYGQHGNFEVIAPVQGGGLRHWWRNNDDGAGERWSLGASQPTPPGDTRPWSGVGLVQASWGGMDLVGVRQDALVHLSQDGPGAPWYERAVIATGVRGRPGLCQGPWGRLGNLEVVVPAIGGGLRHYWLDTDQPDARWQPAPGFGDSEDTTDVALFFSSYDHLELAVARSDGSYVVYAQRWRAPWVGPATTRPTTDGPCFAVDPAWGDAMAAGAPPPSAGP